MNKTTYRNCLRRVNCTNHQKLIQRKGSIMSRESDKLLEIIKKSIEDGIVTNEEYHQIISQAAADGLEDAEERALLSNLQELIASGAVKRVA